MNQNVESLMVTVLPSLVSLKKERKKMNWLEATGSLQEEGIIERGLVVVASGHHKQTESQNLESSFRFSFGESEVANCHNHMILDSH